VVVTFLVRALAVMAFLVRALVAVAFIGKEGGKVSLFRW
jgi:hypothetical protein